jgi:hypothetical protein
MPNRDDPRPVFDARMAIHTALSMVLVWLAFVLILPGNTFSTTPAWRLFAATAPEEAWAIMLFVGGIAGAVGIDTRRYILKIASILMLSTAHGTLALLFLLSNPLGGASGTYAIMALLGYYLAWRLVRWRG